MINAGTVGAYLTLDISDFEGKLAAAGQLMERFRRENGDGGWGDFVSGSVAAAFHSAGTAALRFASDYTGAAEKIRGVSGSTAGAVAGLTDRFGEMRGGAAAAFGNAAEQARGFRESK